MYNKYNLTITGDENPASDIRTSVGTYGGFYIAKYEAGVPLDSDGNEIEPTLATTLQKCIGNYTQLQLVFLVKRV